MSIKNSGNIKNLPKHLLIVTRIFSVLLLAYALMFIIFFIRSLINLDYPASIGMTINQQNLPKGILALILSLIGGVGLWQLKKWAVYSVGVFAIVMFIIRILELMFTKTTPDFTMILFGILGIYILRYRNYFNSNTEITK